MSAPPITANALKHFGLSEAAYCFCWRIVPRLVGAAAQPEFGLPPGYGFPEGYCGLDRNLTIKGLNYTSSANVMPTSVPCNIGLETDGVDAKILFPEAAPLLRERLELRLYEEALVHLFAIPWEAYLAGKCSDDDIAPLLAGRLGSAEFDDDAATFELLPWSVLLNGNIGRKTGDMCDCARFGRGRCKNLVTGDGIDITQFGRTIAATVQAPPEGEDEHGMKIWVSPWVPKAQGWANWGIFRIEAGPLRGAELPIKEWKPTAYGLVEVRLRTPCPVVPDVGTLLSIEEGCDRTPTMCRTKEPNPSAPTGRGNIWNFQGFAAPGQKRLVQQEEVS